MNSNEKKERVPFEELARILHVDLDWCGGCPFEFPEGDACDGCGAEHNVDGSIKTYCYCQGKLKPCWNDPARPALKYFPWCADYHPDFKPCLLVEVLIKSRACPACEKVLELIYTHGGTDGSHHKQWVLDQILRVILGTKYEPWVRDYEKPGDDGDLEYEWDTGIAP